MSITPVVDTAQSCSDIFCSGVRGSVLAKLKGVYSQKKTSFVPYTI